MRLIQRYSPLTLRSDLWRLCLLLVTGVLWVSPLTAQQTVVVPDVNVEVGPTPVTIENNVEVLTDSIMQLRIAEAIEGIRAELATQECNQCGGTPTVVRIGQGALVVAAFFIGWQLKRIADKPNGDTNVDVDVENEIPPHEHERKHKYGESE